MKPHLAPTPKMKRLFHKLVAHWGNPTGVAAFNLASGAPDAPLPTVHVLVWEDPEGSATAFNTLGMAERRMPHADFFAELHCIVNGATTPDERADMARFLANLAEHSFRSDVKFDWWERISSPAGVPLFATCFDVLFHSALIQDDPDDLDDEDGPVKLLYALPLTSYESYVLANQGRKAFADYLAANDVDPFARR
jgi:hypothetical protein